MRSNIPQFIDKEDKIVGPLTAKQLGWLFLGGVIVLVLWSTLNTQSFFLSAIPTATAAIAFAFYKPYNQSLFNFLLSSVAFVSKNKVYLWKRLPEEATPVKKAPVKKTLLSDGPKATVQKIEDLSKILDNNTPIIKK